MVTWTNARREMLRLDPSLGRILPISSLTTTTVVASTFATGGVPANQFVQQWLYRAQASTTADVIRRCTDFASATGTFTHAGTNYSDTTATGENVEILPFEPFLYNVALRDALKVLGFRYDVMLPGMSQRGRYGLGDLLNFGYTAPVSVAGVKLRRSPGLVRNRDFSLWYSHQSDGLLLPDFWTPSTTMVVSKAASEHRRGGFALSDATTGGVVTYTQTADLLVSGTPATNDEDLRGQSVTLFAKVKSSTASQVRLGINDGVTTSYGSYHTGGGAYEELSVTATLSDSATKLEFIIYRANTAGTFVVDYIEALKGSTITDALRRDIYPSVDIETNEYTWDQGAMAINLPTRAAGSQYILSLWRPYGVSTNLQSLIDALTVDTSSVDIPVTNVVAWAEGAIARLYQGLSNAHPDAARRAEFKSRAMEWERKFQKMAGSHMYSDSRNAGFEAIPTRLFGPVPRR